ncbi:hypothetical protein ACFX1X_044378 [Malus domestica]
MAPTVNVCSSVSLTESARSSVLSVESIRYLKCPVRGVHYQNAWFVTSRVASCQDATKEVRRMPLSYFKTPRLGHVASWCAARANSPRSSVVRRRLSTL